MQLLHLWAFGHLKTRGRRSFLLNLPPCGLGLLLSLAIAANAAAAPGPAIANVTVSWQLAATRVVNPGETTALAEGSLTRDYGIESTATSDFPDLMPSGVFRAKLSIFSPHQDRPGQKAGRWYVTGQWSLTDAGAPVSDHPRHKPGAISGQINAELPFNPAVNPANWSAIVRLPQTTLEPIAPATGRQPMRGEGSLTLDDALAGHLTLDLKLWPKI